MREGSVGEEGGEQGREGVAAAGEHGQDARASAGRMVRLGVEFFAIYVAVPTLAAVFVRQFAGLLFPTLIGGGIVLGTLLWRDPAFERRRLLNAAALRRWWWRVLLLVGLFFGALWGVMAAVEPGSLWYLPRERPGLWVAIMIFYPLLSVYPQEIIFRAWLFHRYRGALPRVWMRTAASTLAFGYAHVMFQSWVSIVLTTIGGFVFARTYARSRSTLVVAVEHALYGAVIFTVGLGRYFYLGAVVD